MKKILFVALAVLFVGCTAESAPKLVDIDGKFTGEFFTISYPKTYIVTPIDNGVTIEGAIKFKLHFASEARSQLGSVMPLRATLEGRIRTKSIQFTTVNFNGFDAVKMEGMDDMEQYTFGIYIPLDGGLLILELEPAFMRQETIDFSHRIAETLNITDKTWFERNK